MTLLTALLSYATVAYATFATITMLIVDDGYGVDATDLRSSLLASVIWPIAFTMLGWFWIEGRVARKRVRR